MSARPLSGPGTTPAPADVAASPGRGVWIAVATLALGVRLLHLWAIHDAPVARFLVGDGRAYDAWARQIAAGAWLGDGVFYQAPLYPYFLGVVYAGVGHDLVVVRIVQALLGAAACVLLGKAGSIFFCPRTGVLAATLLAVWPSAFFADALIQKSSLDGVLFCGLLAALAAGARCPGAGWWLATGVLLGGLVLTRENALVFVPVLLVFAGVRSRRALGVFCLGLVVVLGPVALRNRVVGGELHLTTAQFGPNFYIGNNPAATGLYQPLRFGRGDPRYERRDATEIAERTLGRTLTPSEVSAYWTGRALAFIAHEPGRWLALLGRKGVLLVNRVEVGDAEDQYTTGDWSPLLALLGRVLHWGVLVPLAAAGVVLTWPRRRSLAVLLALLLVYTLSVVATFVMARYRHPALPLLLLLAAAAVVEAVRCVRAGRWPPLLRAAAVAACVAVPANWPVVSEAAVRAASLYNIGRSLEEQPAGLDEAIRYYERTLALSPTHALAENNLGVALQRRGRLADAVVHLRRAVDLRPEQGDFHYNLAGALAARGDTDGAVASYTRAIAVDPANADAHANLGVLLHQRGDLDEAVRHYTAALAIEPRNVTALNDLGACYAQQGRLDEAIQAFQSAVAVDPGARSARENLARALAERDRLAGALDGEHRPPVSTTR